VVSKLIHVYTSTCDHSRNGTVNYRPVLSSERALQNNKHADVWRKFCRRKKNWSRLPDGRLTPRQAGRLAVGRKLTSTYALIFRHPSHLQLSRIYFNGVKPKPCKMCVNQRAALLSAECNKRTKVSCSKYQLSLCECYMRLCVLDSNWKAVGYMRSVAMYSVHPAPFNPAVLQFNCRIAFPSLGTATSSNIILAFSQRGWSVG
jgi:hypothetical protein